MTLWQLCPDVFCVTCYTLRFHEVSNNRSKHYPFPKGKYIMIQTELLYENS